ncbi:hypothetical protein ACQGFJ_00010 [Rhodococcus sp. 3.70]
MTGATNDDWDERDRAARSELEVVVRDFDTPGRRGKIRKAGSVTIRRAGDEVGFVSVYQVPSVDWLLETGYIRLGKGYHFDKDVHERGEYQPRWGLFLMEKLFAQFPDKEIRESLSVNDPPGDPFVKRVRGDYALPYHLPKCFLPPEMHCVCGIGRLRSTTSD